MTKHTILFLAANPRGTHRLAVDREERAIRLELQRSRYRACFELVTRGAAEPLDLLRELRELKPTVVHFSGHGGGSPGDERRAASSRDIAAESAHDGDQRHGLFFDSADGGAQFVRADAVKRTFGAAGASALNVKAGKRAISMMGDGGFWHNGLTSGVGNAVFNKSDNVLIIVDNGYSAATGGQDIPSSFHPNAGRSTQNSIETAVRGVGVTWAKTITNTYDVALMRDTLRDALTTEEKGPKVIVAHSECMLNKQRRIRPLWRKAAERGERVVRERFGVDADTCTGDHSCIRLSGCPSLTIAPNPDPLRREPVTKVINSCVGCGLCGEVSHAAVLCPSFYRASLITNPTGWDRFMARVRGAVIGFFQRRIERRLAAA
jgi:NAD-dependent dihydropyrimidine dehydrogenase PreA subunit